MNLDRTTHFLSAIQQVQHVGLPVGTGKALIAGAGVAASLGFAALVETNPVPPPTTAPEFLAAARAVGINGTDPAMLDDGYDVCRKIWTLHTSGNQVAAEMVRDDPGLTSDDATRFTLAAYNHLCPTPAGYDYWAHNND